MSASPNAIRAYADYVALGAARSLEKLAERYQSDTETTPPTRRLTTLKEWSSRYDWQKRVGTHERAIADEALEQDKQKRLKQLEQMREARIALSLQSQRMALDALRRKEQQDRISPYAAVQLMQLAFDTQRKDMLEPDARVEVTGRNGDPITFTIKMDHGGDSAPELRRDDG